MTIAATNKKTYKKLRKHMHKTLHVGMPSTKTGVELRLLQRLFSPEEAKLALHLTGRFNTVDSLYGRLQQDSSAGGLSREDLERMLDELTKRGTIYGVDREGGRQYALHPFAVGIAEMQIWRKDEDFAEFWADAMEYLEQGYAVSIVHTAIPQLRVVPLERSVDHTHAVATYDEIRRLVDEAGDKLAVTRCICRTGSDSLNAECKATKEREICLIFNDWAEVYVRDGYGRKVTKEEMLDLLSKGEKDGLILQPSNAKEPVFVCQCCGCCCGVIRIAKALPHPTNFVAHNYVAQVDASKCEGCNKCFKKCQLDAITVTDAVARVDETRCFGCGVCVVQCKSGAIQLVKNDRQLEPPANNDAMVEFMTKHRPGTFDKVKLVGKVILKRPHVYKAYDQL